MIEVEKKFAISDDQRARLLEGAQLVSEKVNRDTLFDDADNSLTRRELWLRERNGRFELKVPVKPGSGGVPCNIYEELETDEQIRAHLGIPAQGSLVDDLHAAGIVPFVTLVTQRQSYTQGDFGIDLDITTADDGFRYELAEVEVMTDDESAVDAAMARIDAFVQGCGVVPREVNGKILKYIEEKRPDHFAQLVAGGTASPSR